MGWALGAFTTSVLVNSVGLLHMRFMTDSLGIAAGVAGTLVAISKIYDAVTDPLMGWASDRTRTRLGRRRPYLFLGAFLCALAMVLLFNVPRFESHTTLIVYMGAMLILFATAYTIFRTPYLAMPPEMTDTFDQRSRLMSYNVYGSSIGSLFATGLAPLLLTVWGSNRDGHALIAWLLAVLILAGGLGCFWGTARVPQLPVTSATLPGGWRTRVRALAENKPFVSLIAFKVIMFIGLTMHNVAVPFFSRHALKMSDGWLSAVFLVKTITTIVSQPAWSWVSRRLGRRNTLIAAGVSEVICMTSWFFISPENASWAAFPIGVLQGISSGGIFFGLYTALPDTMEYDRLRSGLQREGLFAGIFVMVEKFTAAIATALFGFTMGWLGYLESKDAAGVVQPEAAIQGLYVALSLVPAALAILACVALRWYDLTETKLRTMPRKEDR
jgi:sugar (glycoside-pentoside-hexuronide) transporter